MRIFKIGSVLAGAIAILGFLAAASFAQQHGARAVSAQLQNSGSPLPLVFEMNVGQVDARVKYLSRTRRGALFIESDQAVLILSSPAVMPFRRGGNGHNAPIGPSEGILAMQLIGSNPIAKVEGRGQNIARINYFVGRDPSRWHTNIPTVNEVVTRDAWPGIDVSYGRDPAAPGAVECVFTVRAGADLTAIRLAFDASGAIALTPDGNVEAVVAGRSVTFTRPKVFEEDADGRHEVAAKLVAITTKAPTASHQLQVRFEVARHDRAARLIIDPSLIYSTYFGGSGQPNASTIFDGTGDRVNAIALDNDSNEYLTGATTSPDFPASNDAFLVPCQRCDPAFVTKIDGKTGAIIYSTLLGGGSGTNEGQGYGDAGNGIAIDSSGNAYIAGATFSTNFPTTPGVLFASCSFAGPIPFVTKLSADGSALVYSTYLEKGAVQDYGNAIAIDGLGNAYVTGVINGNAFAIVLNGTGTAATYAVSLASATGYAVALTSKQEMWIGGQSNGKNFPTTSGACQRKCGQCERARAWFVSLLNPSKGSTRASLAYSTYLGGSSAGNNISAIAVDSKNRAWAVGSADVSSLPGKKSDVHCTKGSKCGNHALLAIINASRSGGASLSGSEYFGGDGSDTANAIYLSGNTAYVGGQTTSSNFPVTSNAVQSTYTPCGGPCLTSRGPAFVLVVNPSSKKISFSTILGGATVPSPTSSNGTNKIPSLVEIDGVDGIAVDGNGVIHAAGLTYASGFPTSSDAHESTCKACATLGSDGFIARINPTAATGAEALEYSSFIGGGGPSSAGDYAAGVAMDNTGAVYVAGYTTSPDFPVTAGAFQQTCPGCAGYSLGGLPYPGYASFVAKLNPSAAPGSQLVYAAYLAGSGSGEGSSNEASGIAVDSMGEAYAVGVSFESDFPTTANAYSNSCSYDGGCAYFAKLDSTGSNLLYSSFIGEVGFLYNSIIGVGSPPKVAIDPNNNALISGTTAGSFPTTAGALQSTCGACSSGGAGFFSQINPSASGAASLLYSTYLSGSGGIIGATPMGDAMTAIASDPNGNAVLTGIVTSQDFPTTANAYQTECQGLCESPTITAVNPALSGQTALIYSTYFNGTGGGVTNPIAFPYTVTVDPNHDIYVGGQTLAEDFPVTANGFIPQCPDPRSACDGGTGFVGELNPSALPANQLVYGTYLGGTSDIGHEAVRGFSGDA